MKKRKSLKIPFWVLDGFVGLLGLMIYNFSLYILKIIGAKGIIGQIEDAMGYFCLNSFIDFEFTANEMIFGLTTVLILSFFLGIEVGNFVRKRNKKFPKNKRKRN